MRTKKSIPKAIIILMLIIFAKQLTAQTNGNYVSNGDFESYNTCPSTIPGQFNTRIWYADGWENSNTNIHGGNIPTPDYFNTCDNTGSCGFSLPNNKYGAQSVRLSNTYGYAGLCFNSTYREYITKQLDAALTANVEYEVTFYVSNSEYYYKVLNNIGALLTTSRTTQALEAKLTATPQILDVDHIYNVSGWTKITGTFVATGGEEWITIGCFGDESGTLVEAYQIPSTSSCTVPFKENYEDNSYFFIDDVSIIEKKSPDFTYSFGTANCNLNTVNAFSPVGSSWVSHYWVLSNEFAYSQTSSAQNPVFTNVPAGTYELSHSMTAYGVTTNETKTIVVTGSYHKNEYTAATGTSTWTSSSNPLNNNGGATAKIKNAIVIPANARITVNNMTIVMGPGGKIIVERGGSLEFNNCTLTTNTECSGTMWQGIQVYGNPSYNQTGTNTDANQGYLRLNSSIVEHAVVAVCSYKSGSSEVKRQYAGGVIKAYSTIFRNNRNHVIMNEYRAPNKAYNKSVFQSCSFISTQLLRNTSAYPNQAVLNYVELTLVDKVRFINNLFKTNDELVDDNKRGTGILLNSASVSVYNNNRFTDLYVGIKSINTISFRGNLISENIFSGCIRSIYMINSIGDLITNNTITSSRNGYVEFNPIGIYMVNSKSYIIKNNTLDGSDLLNGFGLAIMGSSNAGATIKENAFTEYNYQFHTENNNRAVLINCNQHNNYNYLYKYAWYINKNSPNNTNPGTLFPEEIGFCSTNGLSGNVFNDDCNSYISQINSGIEFTYNNPLSAGSSDPSNTCVSSYVNISGCIDPAASANCGEDDIDSDDFGTIDNGYQNETNAIRKAAYLNKMISIYMSDSTNNETATLFTWLNSNEYEHDEIRKYKILQSIYDLEMDVAFDEMGYLESNSENDNFISFYTALITNYDAGHSLDSLSEEMIFEIENMAGTDDPLKKLAEQLHIMVDNNVADYYNLNPYVEEELEETPVTNNGTIATGLIGDSDISSINMFPNPANQRLYFDGLSSEFEIELIDMFAKRVYVSKINNEINSIDLSDFSNGMYIVLLKNGTEIIKREKLIISK